MDSRITKKRLSDFLSYEWIVTIVFCVVAVLVWELIYSVSAVRLTVGQSYKIYFDTNYDYNTYGVLYEELKDKEALSYDVLKIGSEKIMKDTDLLATKLVVYDGDLLFTDDIVPEDEDGVVLAKYRVDSTEVYDLEELKNDSLKYLQSFLYDGYSTQSLLELDYNNLDPVKIEKAFYKRMKKDNRFRSASQKALGLEQELERIKRLCEDTADFCELLTYEDLFFRYTKYEQSKDADDYKAVTYKKLYDEEVEAGRVNCKYGFRIDNLKNYYQSGKKDTTEFFQIINQENKLTSEHSILMVFNFVYKQPELQFESIRVINTIVRACTNILDN